MEPHGASDPLSSMKWGWCPTFPCLEGKKSFLKHNMLPIKYFGDSCILSNTTDAILA